jgi:hypothetical protein
MNAETGLARGRTSSPLGLSWPLVIGCAAVVLGLLQGSRLLEDPDTLWHLASGRWIFEQQQIPSTDPFSHSMHGSPWTAHEWLSGLLLFLTFEQFSWTGPVVATSLAFGLAVGSSARFLFRRLLPIRALLVSALVILSLSPYLLARPHVLAWPFLAFWAAHGIERVEGDRTPSWWLVGLMVLWANLHASFIVGLGLSVMLAVEAVQTAPDAASRARLARHWGGFVLAILAASLLTPHHIHGLSFPFRVSGMSFTLSHIDEWRPPNFQQFTLAEVWILGLFLIGWFLRPKLPLIRILALLAVVHMTLAHARHMSLLLILAPILIATPLARALAKLTGERQTGALDRAFQRLTGPATKPSVAACILIAVGLPLLIGRGRFAPPARYFPDAAVAAAREASGGQLGNVLNAYDFGGYLILSRIPPFIDGRADMYGDAFVKQYVEAVATAPGKLTPLVDRYAISWTLMPPRHKAVGILDALPDWTRVHGDETAVVHLRSGK